MKNTFGNSISVTLFGESHGEAIGAVIDGLAPGIPVSKEAIEAALAQRRPTGRISTARSEQDAFQIVSGVFSGKTTGTPLCILIPNAAAHSADYNANALLARPGHADFTAECKYHGFQDFRGGGHFSGRITAALVAAGAILRTALAVRGIRIGTHILRIGNVCDRDFHHIENDIDLLNSKQFPVLSDEAGENMQQYILSAAHDGDSVGGILESAVVCLPRGVGEPWFDSVESLLSHALFSIPGVKGVEFGAGFGFANMHGSEANDAFLNQGGKIITSTNHNGGINGGITNGMPILFRTVVKPTPSIYKTQQTVSIKTKENASITIEGRHDPCIVHRARAVVDAMTAFTIADLLAQRYGTDWFSPVS